MINKQQKLEHIEKFCADLYETSQIRFQPHNPPVDLILNHLMEEIAHLKSFISIITSVTDDLAQKLDAKAPVKEKKPKAVKDK